ncbi:MAG: transglycosylase family protein [Propioniciclava sp.]
MPFTNKLAAVASSAAILAAGGAAVAVSAAASASPAPSVSVATPSPQPEHSITVKVDNASTDVRVDNASVASALVAAGVELGADDRVSPKLGAELSDGDTITVKRVSTTQWTRTKKVAFTTTKVNDSSLLRGTTKVKTAGVKGKKVQTMLTTTVDGKVADIEVIDSKVTKKPVTEVILVGTKAPVVVPSSTPSSSGSSESSGGSGGSGAGINLANAAMWDRIAQCESTGRWNINTGNGYYGGLQFNLATWRSVGGGDFAAYPHQASRAEQITVANRLYAQRGLQPWGCRHAA